MFHEIVFFLKITLKILVGKSVFSVIANVKICLFVIFVLKHFKENDESRDIINIAIISSNR